MLRPMLIVLLSLVAFASCSPEDQPMDPSSWISQYEQHIALFAAFFILGILPGMMLLFYCIDKGIGVQKIPREENADEGSDQVFEFPFDEIFHLILFAMLYPVIIASCVPVTIPFGLHYYISLYGVQVALCVVGFIIGIYAGAWFLLYCDGLEEIQKFLKEKPSKRTAADERDDQVIIFGFTFLLSLIAIISCSSIDMPMNLNYWMSNYGVHVSVFIAFITTYLSTNVENEPTTGDTEMLSFICGSYCIFTSLKSFAEEKKAYVDSLANLFGKDATVELFHRYLVRMSNNGRGACQKWYGANVDTFSEEDDKNAMVAVVETVEKKYFAFGDLDFVDAVRKIVEHVEKYLEEQKEFIDTLTTDDKDAIKVLKKLEQLVKIGNNFVDSFNDNNTVADSDNVDQLDTTSETLTADYVVV